MSLTHYDVCIDDEWILDSGFSYHMCSDQDWFTTYKAVNDETILMKNNMWPCKMVRIGTVWIRMHDCIVRTMTDV